MRVVWISSLCLLAACSSQENASPSAGGTGGAAGSVGDAASDVGDGAPPAPYSVDAFDSVRISSDSNAANFQKAVAEIDFGPGPFEKVTLVADLASTCYPFDGWAADPPPTGQNWPADCDAFDRNYEFTLDPPADPAQGPPGIELERAITPFGGPLHLSVDVTDVANGLPGKHQLRVVIPTWSDASGQVTGSAGGWNVSAHFDVVPGTPPRNVIAVVPLYDGVQTDPAPMAPIELDVPANTTSSRLEFRATGHGGVVGPCPNGPAEEFCIRTFSMIADETSFTDIVPWRDDCDTLCTLAHQDNANGGFDYCKENPCGAIASVKAPRANWCPGSETPPFSWDLPGLRSEGKHGFRWQIDGEAQGGSWRLSAVYFAFGP